MITPSVRTQPRSGAAAEPTVELVELTKVFPAGRGRRPRVTAVDRIGLRVGAGQIFGLLGPNGAGKSTTIRMIATLLEPTAGSVRVCGVDVQQHPREARRHLGVVLGGERSVYWKLTARQNLEYFATLQGLPRKEAAVRIPEVLARMDLGGRADDYVERYSTGMRQRLVIARALLCMPSVLLLDEPTSGLDPQAAADLRAHVRELKEDGHTVMLTTHHMEEADHLSDRLAIIDRGRIVAEGAPAELKRRIDAQEVVHVRLRTGRQDNGGPAALLDELARSVALTAQRHDGDTLLLTMGSRLGDDLVPWLITTVRRHGATVVRVEAEPVSLEDVFLSLTGRELRE